jgi:hypothetical protein
VAKTLAAAGATHEGAAGDVKPVAAAFAVAGESGVTLLPGVDCRAALAGVDPGLPVAVKYLGRWVVVALGEMPSG